MLQIFKRILFKRQFYTNTYRKEKRYSKYHEDKLLKFIKRISKYDFYFLLTMEK